MGLGKNKTGHSRVLVRGVNWIGDAVMTMPAIRSLRDNLPESHIAMLAKPWVLPVFAHDPNINELLEYRENYRGIPGKFRAGKDLRKQLFDCSVLLQNAFDAAVLAALARIPRRIGYNRDGRRLFLTDAVPADQSALRLHHIEYYLNLLRKAGFTAGYRLPWIYPDLNERKDARRLLVNLKRPVVGLNPGAAYGSAKRWPSVKFAAVASAVIRDMGGSVVVFGSEKERPISEEITASIDRELVSDSSVLNLCGRTTLSSLGNLMAECDLLVTNDSGPMHVAYAVGTPLIALFGSTSPELTGPPESAFDGAELGFRFRALKSDAACAPCFERTCRYGTLECMELITVESVIESILDLLPRRRAVFFDRDGTLCRDANYLSRMDDLEIFPEISKLKALKGKGYLLIGISNQSGIARGKVDEPFVRKVNSIFTGEHGFDAFYYCPHHPDDRCACRKPMPGMLLKARAEFGIDLKSSLFVGDSKADMEVAAMTGAKAVQISTSSTERLPHSDLLIKSLDECNSVIRILPVQP